jgi:hypothetical protein
MKMSVFFKSQIVEWEITIPSNKVNVFRKALKEFKINLYEVESYKNKTTRVEFHCVCNDLLKIGIEYGALLAEEAQNTSKSKDNP